MHQKLFRPSFPAQKNAIPIYTHRPLTPMLYWRSRPSSSHTHSNNSSNNSSSTTDKQGLEVPLTMHPGLSPIHRG